MKNSTIFIFLSMLLTSQLFGQVTSNSPICEGDNFVITVSAPGNKFLVENPQGNESEFFISTIVIPGNQVIAGDYQVGVINGDTTFFTVSAVITPTPSAPTITGSNSYCEGETITLTASSPDNPDGYRWLLNDGRSFDQNPFTITATPAIGNRVRAMAVKNGCEGNESTFNFTVTRNPTAQPTITGLNNPYCTGDNIRLIISNAGNQDVDWEFPDGNRQNIKDLNTTTTLDLDGTHNIRFESNGCQGPIRQINVVVNETPDKPEIEANKETLCTNDTLILNVEDANGFQSKWTFPSGTISQTDTIRNTNVQSTDQGTYTVVLTNGNCESEESTIDINTTQSPVLNDFFTNTPICALDTFKFFVDYDFGGTTTIRDTLGNVYNTDTLIIDQMIHQKEYFLIVSNDNGCESTIDTISTPIFELIINAPITGTDEICEDEDIFLSATSHEGAFYVWNGPDVSQDTIQNLLINDAKVNRTGIYTVRYESMCDTLLVSKNVVVNPNPSFFIRGDSAICVDERETATFKIEPEFPRYSWNNGANTQEITVDQDGVYRVEVENEFGCTSTQNYDLPNKCFPRFYMPTAFTPNGDGLNEEFIFYNHNLDVTEATIYNKWGEVMFKTNDLNIGWDGTYLGQDAPEGTYVYVLKYKTIFRGVVNEQRTSSFFTLIR